MPRSLASLVLLVALLTAACSEGSGTTSESTTTDTAPGSTIDTAPTDSVVDAGSSTTAPEDAILEVALRCDPLDERACLLPWPNDAFTVPDDSTETGRRLDIHPESTPTNAQGVHIDVTDQNRADGFSPVSTILAMVPGLDVETTGIAPSTDIGASLADDAPVVLLDTTSGERVPYWAELDAPAPVGDQLLTIHPASSLPEGHRIVVGLRNMKDADGRTIERSTAFQAALDNAPEPLERARSFRELIGALADDGVDTDSLYLAWDFTVASADSLSGRVLHMRELAYAGLGDDAPGFRVLDQTENGVVRAVTGSFEVPNFLSGDGSPGNSMLLDDDGAPVVNPDTPIYEALFRCVVPVRPAEPVPAIVYGHGLLGSRLEVDSLAFAAESGIAAVCATDEIGLSAEDSSNIGSILSDFSNFNEQADRLQQGLLNQQFLGRLLNHEQGFVSSPAFQSWDGGPLIAVGDTQFVGSSQGGNLGGAASAISTEWSRVVLNVAGMNYSLLLPRSSSWPQFRDQLEGTYADHVDLVLALQLSQLLSDRGENSGYAQHLTGNPYPGIEPKRVLLVQAFGDHQVANISTEVLARSIEASVYEPSLRPGRSADVDPQWGMDALDFSAPSNGVLMVWDFGTPAPPTVNLPPLGGEYGSDPHGGPSSEQRVLQQTLTFLLTGELLDVCAGDPCSRAS